MKIVSVSIVYDESDIIESFIRYTLNVVDQMIILNYSTDDTNIILSKLINENLPIVIYDRINHSQDIKSNYDFLLNEAFDKYAADIVCLLNADEFIAYNYSNPRDIIKNIDKYTYYKVNRKTYIPTSYDDNAKFIPSRIKYIRDENLEFKHNIIFTKDIFYEFHAQIDIEKQDLIYDNEFMEKITCKEHDKLYIAHFPFRSINQSMNKILKIYPQVFSKKDLNSELKKFYQDMFCKIKNENMLTIDDISEFAKRDLLIESTDYVKSNKKYFKISYNPMNLNFCKNIGVKYDFNDFLHPKVLKNYFYLLNTIKTSYFLKENYHAQFQNQLTELKKSSEPLVNKYNPEITSLTSKLISLDSHMNNNFDKFAIILKLIKHNYLDLKIAIKSPNPVSDKKWGDYFYALALKKSFEKKGFNVVIHERENWYCDEQVDINIVLRGLIDYTPKINQINIMWNISHPNDIPIQEYEKYDMVFIASDEYAKEMSDKVNTIVKPLLQCTDPDVFYPNKQEKYKEEILFVGITRGIFRPIISDLIKTDYDFSVYGGGWEKFIDEKHIKGEFIPNTDLNKFYSSCEILLNDHWDDMCEKNFVSNRIFDALACKSFIISDEVKSIEKLFEGNVVTYTNPNDLKEKIDYYLSHDDERELMSKKGYEIVLKNHTFDNRVSEILSALEQDYFLKFINEFIVFPQ